MAEVTVELDGGGDVVASITVESARRLDRKSDRRVTAVIKSTEVMIAVED